MKIIHKITTAFLLSFALLMVNPSPANAQCPMCKIAAESNLENGGTAGKGLNQGILLMFSMPYVMVGLIGFMWYKNKRKEEEVDFDRF